MGAKPCGRHLEQAREASARRDWGTARRAYRAADGLTAEDLGALADACWWLGLPDEYAATTDELYRRLVHDQKHAAAGMAALKLGFTELVRGHEDAGAAWLARARRRLVEVPEAVEHGYLKVVDAEVAAFGGDLALAQRLTGEVLALAEREEEPTLQALALFGMGELSIRRARVRQGLEGLDEALLLVQTGQVAAEWAGNLYCRMMQVCHDLADYPRARHWTAVTEEWCEQNSPAVLFDGICRVHRVQVMQVRGEWAHAMAEAERAVEDLAGLDVEIAAEAYYRIGEVRRLEGALAESEAAYRRAHELGRDPLPGLALLHLRRGRREVAASVLDAALVVADAPLDRAPMLAARAEVAAAGDRPIAADPCVEELARIAEDHLSPGWSAEVKRLRGAVLLACGKHADAARVLGEARTAWQRIDAPYDVARIRLDLADAYDALGDPDTAEREREQAAAVLARLGARLDLERVRAARRAHRTPGDLSARELEVVAAIATGGTNRDAAERLFISERTVGRHLANVYLKIGVSSRTAAVAWARDHGLV